ncbi:KpsF/GutQ family sugar-phosphate isomerase [Alisedimentitalea sp. MJ-SS2]|uniref:KpsF/GutQ family sugar-phosphate isomerase n=1 Tax=Aliisedimentitalea sp. MJ-SS2 TaxID=3049795 RepID=UPI00290EB90B|nr:KpsF/GutQ family sugar-phosphate isomerase [Alisedimentitalea sp. MJ-SS2]MDU8930050.1 KpsF/GutQ family sugar-phosphate isomerase [Alisedimentitalea sp. MJ-SS2]
MSDETTSTSRDTGIRVLRTEAQALSQMAQALPDGFEQAVEMILEAPGRVIVAGIGKSGHIGRKIAATLASTGTPADFLHAAEASHGDMGMVTTDDVCILISRSGETAELGDLLRYTRRFSVPMIAISSKPESTLMQAADCGLLLPDLPEACAIGLAPTTSTTLTLALGDALAVAVMEARGFGPEDFQTFHPGGKLGAQLMRVEELMHGAEALPLCAPGDAMTDVLLTMTSKSFGIAAVVDDGRLAGVISDGDLRRHVDGLMQLTARDVATPDPVTVTPDMLAAQALALLNERKISVLMVVDQEHRPLGVLHIHDLLRAGVA